MEKRYRIKHIKGYTYGVYSEAEFIVGGDKWNKYEFGGSILECEAFIRLKDDGYMWVHPPEC